MVEPRWLWSRFFCLLATMFPLVTAATAGEPRAFTVSAPTIPPPLAQRIPLRVGLCLSPVLRGAVVVLENQEAALGAFGPGNRERKHWNLGNAVVATVAATMRASFQSVTILEQCAPNTAATGNYQAIVVAQLLDARALLPGWQSTLGEQFRRQAQVDLLVTLRSADGRPSLTWNVSGSAITAHRLLSTDDDVATSFSGALRNASARLLADLSLNSTIGAWFAATGVRGEAATVAQTAGLTQETPRAEPSTSAIGKIAIVSYGLGEQVGTQTTLQCLSKALEVLDDSVQLIPEEQARDAFFPWFEHDVLSKYADDARLVSQLIQERARQTDLQFVVLPSIVHTGSARNGLFECGGGYGGAGCLGAAAVQRNSEVTAAIWDLRGRRQARALTGQGRAQDLLIGFVLPLWIPGGGSTKAHACQELGRALLDVMHGDSKARLEPMAGPSAAEPLTDGAITADMSSEGAAADAGIWSDELSLNYLSVVWFAGTEDIGNSQILNTGRRGTLRVTDKTVVFKDGAAAGDKKSLRLPFDEILSVEYRTSRIDGHIGHYAYFAVVKRKSGQVDSLAIIKSNVTARDDTKALAEVLQSKLR